MFANDARFLRTILGCLPWFASLSVVCIETDSIICCTARFLCVIYTQKFALARPLIITCENIVLFSDRDTGQYSTSQLAFSLPNSTRRRGAWRAHTHHQPRPESRSGWVQRLRQEHSDFTAGEVLWRFGRRSGRIINIICQLSAFCGPRFPLINVCQNPPGMFH